MKRRGISPLIATVLIIGFVVALAAVVMTWGQTFIKGMQEESEKKAAIELACTSDVNLEIKSVDFVEEKIKLLIENKGKKEITKLNAEFHGNKGTSRTTTTLDPPLPFLSFKEFEMDYDWALTGRIEHVKVFPNIEVEGQPVTCPNAYYTYNIPKHIDAPLIVLVDRFDSYDEAIWEEEKGSGNINWDNGKIRMTGGNSWNTKFYENQVHKREGILVMKADFRSPYGCTMVIGTVDNTVTKGYGICIHKPPTILPPFLSIYPARPGIPQIYMGNSLTATYEVAKWYTLEIEFDEDESRLYVYDKSQPKPEASRTFGVAEWNPKFYVQIYSGYAYIDNVIFFNK